MASSTIYTSLATNGFFCIVLLLCFEFFRRIHVDIYCPLSRLPGRPKPSKLFGGWVLQCFRFKDEEILRLAGMDGYVYIRFLWLCCRLCGGCLLGAVILMCVYGTGPGVESVNGVDTLSMANIVQQSDRLWASFIFMYVFTFLFLYLLHMEYAHFTVMRQRFYGNDGNFDTSVPAQTKYTVLVKNIPASCQTSEKLRLLFERIFPNEVLYAHVALECTELDRVLRARDAAVRQLELAHAVAAADAHGRRPTVFVRDGEYSPWLLRNYCAASCCVGAGVEEVDSLTYWGKKHAALCAQVQQLQAEAQAATYDPRSAQHDRSDRMRRGRLEKRSTRRAAPAAAAAPGAADATGAADAADADASDMRGSVASAASEYGFDEFVRDGSDVSSDYTDSSKPQGLSLKALDAAHVTAAMRESADTFWGKVLDVRDGVGDLGDRMLATRDKLARRLSSATGFVTFRHRRTQLVAAHVPVLCREHPAISVTSCPAPDDILWENLGASVKQAGTVRLLTKFIFYAGLLFWAVVLAFVAAMSTVSKLQRYLPWLQQLSKEETAILQGLLPAYLMMGVMWLLSTTIMYISQYVERRLTKSKVQMTVMRWFYLYQLASVYFFLLAGSIWQLLNNFIKDPAGIITQISTKLPSVAIFFMSYIITAWLLGAPVLLLRPLQTLQLYFYQLLYPPMRITRNMLVKGPFEPEAIKYGTAYPLLLYTLLVVQLYWVIAPLVLIFGGYYFLSMYVTHKYLFVFAVVKEFESGGKFWYKLYTYSMVGLMVSTIIGIAYMAVKEGVTQAPALLPLPLLVLASWRRTELQFASRSYNIPYDEATREDHDQSTPTSATATAAVAAPQKNESDAASDGSANASDVELALLSQQQQQLQQQQAEGGASSTAAFSATFIMQPQVVQPAYKQPYPHRIDNIPLLPNFTSLHEIYWTEFERDQRTCSGEGVYVPPATNELRNPIHDLAAVAEKYA